MDNRQLRFLQLFGELAKVNILDTKGVELAITPIIKLDFGFGVDVWEYLTSVYVAQIAKDIDATVFYGNTLLEIFYTKSVQKTTNAILEIESIARFVFVHNPLANQGIPLNIILNAISANKVDVADLCLALVAENKHVPFSTLLKILVEHMIADTIKKCNESGKKVTMPRKLSNSLLDYIERIRGPEKFMLAQRIKEVI